MVPTDDFLLDLIQTEPESKGEDAIRQQYSDDTLPGPSSCSGSSWETLSETRLKDIKNQLTHMNQERGSRSRSRSPLRAGCGCPCLGEIKQALRNELNQLHDHPRVIMEHFFPEVIDFGIEGNYEVLRNHALTKVHHLVEEEEPQPFYIGICVSAVRRWIGYDGIDLNYKGHRRKWENMFLICAADGPTVARLEDDLLSQQNYLNHNRCTNKIRGGGHKGPTNVISFLYLCREHYIE